MWLLCSGFLFHVGLLILYYFYQLSEASRVFLIFYLVLTAGLFPMSFLSLSFFCLSKYQENKGGQIGQVEGGRGAGTEKERVMH